MKYVVSWTARGSGSAAEMEVGERRSMEVFAKWAPDPSVTFHQFVQRVDGEGGFSVVETDNPETILADSAKFSPWFAFEVFPVVDMTDAVAVFNDAIEFRDSIT